MSSITNLISVGVNGTGTANSVMKWLDADTATDSIIYDNGTNIGIGTSTPTNFVPFGYGPNIEASGGRGGGFVSSNSDGTYKMVMSVDSSNPRGALKTLTNHDLVFGTNDVERMRITSSGNVGIGTSSPAAQLQVESATGGVLRLSSSDTSTVQGDAIGKIEMYTNDGSSPFGVGVVTTVQTTSNSNGSEYDFTISKRRGGAGGAMSMSLGNGYSGSIGFSTSPTGNDTPIERMRISNTGEYFAVSAGNVGLSQGITASAGTSFALFVGRHSATAGTYASGTNSFIVWSNGNVVNTNGSYGSLSDVKLKENITDATPKLDDLLKVKVRNYNLIGDETKQLGVVAQELKEVFPSMIDESPDFEDREVEVKDEEGNIVYKTEQVLVSEAVLDEEGNVIEEAVYETVTTDEPEMTTERVDLGTTTKSVKYSVFVPMLIKAMQEQQEIINDLKARIETLETK